MRSRGHRVKHDTRMLDWPQRPVGAVNVLVLGAQFGSDHRSCARIDRRDDVAAGGVDTGRWR